MIVRLEIPERRLSDEQMRQLRRHLEALEQAGGKRLRNLKPILNLLTTEDDQLGITVERT